jgi:hypothetical protein
MRHVAVLLPLAFVATAPLAAAEPVAVPAFNSVELRGGGKVVVRPGPASVTLLKGSAAFTSFRVDANGQLKIDACNSSCPRNYDLNIEIRYPRVLPMAIKGGGEISAAAGFGPQHELAAGVSGGGTIDLRSVRAETVAAGVNGGGTILVGASNSLAAAVNGGGEVLYSGNPQVTTAIRGGGTVERSE